MFSLCLKNACEDYEVFIDDCKVDLSFSGTTASYQCELSKGVHLLRIKKENKKIGIGAILALWLTALVGSYDTNNISIYRASKKIDITYKLNIEDLNCRCVFDTYKNNITCTSEHSLESKTIDEDSVAKRKFFLFVKIPVAVLSFSILIPLWFMSLLAIVKSFELAPFLLLLILTGLVTLFIFAFFRDRKNKW